MSVSRYRWIWPDTHFQWTIVCFNFSHQYKSQSSYNTFFHPRSVNFNVLPSPQHLTLNYTLTPSSGIPPNHPVQSHPTLQTTLSQSSDHLLTNNRASLSALQPPPQCQPQASASPAASPPGSPAPTIRRQRRRRRWRRLLGCAVAASAASGAPGSSQWLPRRRLFKVSAEPRAGQCVPWLRCARSSDDAASVDDDDNNNNKEQQHVVVVACAGGHPGHAAASSRRGDASPGAALQP